MASNSPESRQLSLEREVAELQTAKSMVESDVFQKYFATPLYQEKKQLKDAYDCDSLKELHNLKGKKWGIEQFFKQVNVIETKLRFALRDLEKL